jgi:hypothetical protein
VPALVTVEYIESSPRAFLITEMSTDSRERRGVISQRLVDLCRDVISPHLPFQWQKSANALQTSFGFEVFICGLSPRCGEAIGYRLFWNTITYSCLKT